MFEVVVGGAAPSVGTGGRVSTVRILFDAASSPVAASLPGSSSSGESSHSASQGEVGSQNNDDDDTGAYPTVPELQAMERKALMEEEEDCNEEEGVGGAEGTENDFVPETPPEIIRTYPYERDHMLLGVCGKRQFKSIVLDEGEEIPDLNTPEEEQRARDSNAAAVSRFGQEVAKRLRALSVEGARGTPGGSDGEGEVSPSFGGADE